jgi:hypothetical protein
MNPSKLKRLSKVFDDLKTFHQEKWGHQAWTGNCGPLIFLALVLIFIGLNNSGDSHDDAND